MLIPGFLISLLTFPGVIVHELAHLLCCRWCRVPVHKVCYFRLGNPSGYVLHEVPDSPLQSLFICLGPFFINTLLGLVIGFPASRAIFSMPHVPSADFWLLWLGVSIAMHAFPSTGDARSLWAQVTRRGISFLWRLLFAPIILIIYLGALGSILWLDLFYGVGVALLLPKLLMGH